MKVTATQLQRGPCLKLIFSFEEIGDLLEIEESDFFNINNLAEVRFKFNLQSINMIYSISARRHESVPATSFDSITMKMKCEQLSFFTQVRCDGKWTPYKRMGVLSKSAIQETMKSLKMTLVIVSKLKVLIFKDLYEELDFCDFSLKAGDSEAVVPVHKACISLHSDVLRRMLQGEWKENKNDCIEIEGTTFETLCHLKRFIYLGVLPDDGLKLRSLLLLAKCYMINNLLTECVISLSLTVKPEDLYSLQEFAIDNKIPELMKSIVQITSDETVQIAYEMENIKNGDKEQTEKN